MSTKFRHCSHCGSPYKGNPCYWSLKLTPEQAAMGFDRPCDCDAASDESYERERRFGRRLIFWGLIVPVGLLTLIFCLS